ncbi:MAG: hypothetical protein JWP11_1912 [Frankiales bacterium]|nr:hypothetical protein [Frankiales bacterium]
MTTIAAVARDGQVWMAADSATNVYDRPIFDGARKIRRINASGREFLLGCCGAGGMADVMGYRLAATLAAGMGELTDLQYWAANVAWAANVLAVEAGLAENGRQDGSLLLGCAGQLWVLSEVQAIRIPDGVCALGSGEGPAMGALDILLEQGAAEAESVRRAVDVAVARDRHSQAPVYVEHLARVAT